MKTEAIENRHATEPATWQARKSASTRVLILDAAIGCFFSNGYAQTTTTKIADRAGLSRGAMLHHFPSKTSLVVAAIDHLNELRLSLYRDKVAAIPEGSDLVDDGIEAYWEVATDPTFAAFHELTVAARTDSELADILEPALEKFQKQFIDLTRELFPDWRGDPETFALASELTKTIVDGLAIDNMTMPSPDKNRRLLAYLKGQIHALLARVQEQAAQ